MYTVHLHMQPCLLGLAMPAPKPEPIPSSFRYRPSRKDVYITTATWSSIYFPISPKKHAATMLMPPNAMLV